MASKNMDRIVFILIVRRLSFTFLRSFIEQMTVGFGFIHQTLLIYYPVCAALLHNLCWFFVDYFGRSFRWSIRFAAVGVLLATPALRGPQGRELAETANAVRSSGSSCALPVLRGLPRSTSSRPPARKASTGCPRQIACSTKILRIARQLNRVFPDGG